MSKILASIKKSEVPVYFQLYSFSIIAICCFCVIDAGTCMSTLKYIETISVGQTGIYILKV